MQSLGDHPHQSPAQRANSEAKLYYGERYDADLALRLNGNNGTCRARSRFVHFAGGQGRLYQCANVLASNMPCAFHALQLQ
jgi:hypothetical protein